MKNVGGPRVIRVPRTAAAVLVVAVAVLGLSPTAGAAPVSLFSSTTPGVTSMVVPAGVCFVTVVADGGHGGTSFSIAGGVAAQVTARFAVTPGDVLGVHVAGAGGNVIAGAAGVGGAGGGGGGDSNGGGAGSGGGGASAVWTGTATPMVVAGGGGGSYSGDPGGAAGLLGQSGANGAGFGSGAGGTAAGVGGAGAALGSSFPGAGGGGGVTGGGAGGATFFGAGGAGGVGDGSIGGGGGGAGGGGTAGGVGGAAPGSGTGGTSAGPGGSGGAGTPTGGNGGASGNGSTGAGGGGGVGFGGGGGGAPGGGTGGGGGAGYGGGGGGLIGGGGGGSSFAAAGVSSSSSVASARTGDGQVEISSDPATDACVAPATTTALASNHNPSRWGQAVTFTATVTSSAGTPTGSVTFSLINEDTSTEVLGTGTLTAGVATFTTATLPRQHGQIVADYTATTSFAGSTQILAQAVLRSESKPLITAARRVSESGDDVVYRVTVASTGDGSGIPAGLVALYRERPNGSRQWIGRGDLRSGATTITVSDLPVGSYRVFAEYRGSDTYRPSVRRMTQTVKA